MIKLKTLINEIREMPEEDAVEVFQSFGIDVSKLNGSEIKKIYRKLATKLHPDKESGDLEKMKLLNAAYESLKSKQASSDGGYGERVGWPNLSDIYFPVTFFYAAKLFSNAKKARWRKGVVNVIYTFEGVNQWLVMMGPGGKHNNEILPKDQASQYKKPSNQFRSGFYYPGTNSIALNKKFKKALFHVPYETSHYAYFTEETANELLNNLASVGINAFSMKDLPLMPQRIRK